MFDSFIKQHSLSVDFIKVAKKHFVPIANKIITKQPNLILRLRQRKLM